MKSITVNADTLKLDEVTGFVMEELEKVDCPAEMQTQIDMVIDEVFSNIAHYAYGDAPGSITVQFDYIPEKECVVLAFCDSGVPFNPLTNEDPDTSLSSMERKVGGLGIYLVKKMMDEVSYERLEGQNMLTVEKIIKSEH